MDPLELVGNKLTLYKDPEGTDPAVIALVLAYNVVSNDHEVKVEGGKTTTREDLARMMKEYPHHHIEPCQPNDPLWKQSRDHSLPSHAILVVITCKWSTCLSQPFHYCINTTHTRMRIGPRT